MTLKIQALLLVHLKNDIWSLPFSILRLVGAIATQDAYMGRDSLHV